MTDLSDKSCVVLDHGFFLEVAHRLSRDFGKVYYVDPGHEEAMAKVDHAVIGDGFPNIERVSEIWEVIDKVDCCVFPDIHHGYMQEHIAGMGMPVWGGRRADELELKKAMFRALQRQMGMNVPEYEVIRGLDDLREFCQNPKHDDRWIKITPQFRGNKETFHHATYEETRCHLDEMGAQFGILQDVISFIAEKSIEAKVELGMDTYTVRGAHPNLVINGVEGKDKCYFGFVQPYRMFPEAARSISDLLWPLLAKYGCCQFLSTEVKMTDEGEPYLLEPTVRMPSPAGECQLELYENFSQIIWEGAHGNLIEPEIEHHFACEAMVEQHGDDKTWRCLKVPNEIRRWVKLYSAARVGDFIGIAPGESIIGAVVGVGDSPKEALDHLKENCEALKDQPVTIAVEALNTVLDSIDEAEAAGIHFTDEPLPSPADVIEGA